MYHFAQLAILIPRLYSFSGKPCFLLQPVLMPVNQVMNALGCCHFYYCLYLVSPSAVTSPAFMSGQRWGPEQPCTKSRAQIKENTNSRLSSLSSLPAFFIFFICENKCRSRRRCRLLATATPLDLVSNYQKTFKNKEKYSHVLQKASERARSLKLLLSFRRL